VVKAALKSAEKLARSGSVEIDIRSQLLEKKGVSEEVVRLISAKNSEQEKILDWRLSALAKWRKMKEPHWAFFDYDPLDYKNMRVFAEPVKDDAADRKIKLAYEKLGVPLHEREILQGMAVDAVVDSRSVATTYKKELAEKGIIFCSFGEALKKHLPMVLEYLGSVVPVADNFFAALNAALFSDGTFVYIPKGVKCPIELSSYFRLQTEKLGQFERTLIIADEGSELTYLEGCSAPMRSSHQLHAGVVELIALDGAKINYATVQNWSDSVLNFVTKRGLAHKDATIVWTQLEVGAALTWKYPSCILKGDGAKGEFFSVAITNNSQTADTGTRMTHIGADTKSVIRAKSIALGKSLSGFRSLVRVEPAAIGAKSSSKCDSLVLENARALAEPVLEDKTSSAAIAHEASVSSISAEQKYSLALLGLDEEAATSLIVNGFAHDIVRRLPAEFAVEARALINLKLEE